MNEARWYRLGSMENERRGKDLATGIEGATDIWRLDVVDDFPDPRCWNQAPRTLYCVFAEAEVDWTGLFSFVTCGTELISMGPRGVC